jgi:hypothetical protein
VKEDRAQPFFQIGQHATTEPVNIIQYFWDIITFMSPYFHAVPNPDGKYKLPEASPYHARRIFRPESYATPFQCTFFHPKNTNFPQ